MFFADVCPMFNNDKAFVILWTVAHQAPLSKRTVSYVSCIGGSDGKESAGNVGDPGLIPRLGRSPGEGNGYTLKYSCLENSMDRGAWWTIVHEVSMSRTRVK